MWGRIRIPSCYVQFPVVVESIGNSQILGWHKNTKASFTLQCFEPRADLPRCDSADVWLTNRRTRAWDAINSNDPSNRGTGLLRLSHDNLRSYPHCGKMVAPKVAPELFWAKCFPQRWLQCELSQDNRSRPTPRFEASFKWLASQTWVLRFVISHRHCQMRAYSRHICPRFKML